jgi:diguanylate cyclase (GGDEF)-like protein
MDILRNLDISDEMRLQANKDIANRSITGCFIYLLIWFAIIIPYKVYITDPEIFLWATLVFVILAALRIYLLFQFKNIYSRNPVLWKLLFYPLVLLPALGWGILCSISFIHPDFEHFSLVIIISTAGLTGGGVAALVPNRPLTVGLLSCFLLPGMVTSLLLTEAYNISITLMFGIYWIGMYSVTRNQHREYWQALNYSFIIKRHASDLEHLNTLDGLTGLKNRKFFDDSLRKELKAASRSQSSLALLLFDIDHFKKINDRFGHLVGDECLRSLTKLFQKQVKRDTDIVARYGGEEFGIILPDCDIIQATDLAEKIRKSVENHTFKNGNTTISFTLSVGVASEIPSADFTVEQLIERADGALYKAKRDGRNQVCR